VPSFFARLAAMRITGESKDIHPGVSNQGRVKFRQFEIYFLAAFKSLMASRSPHFDKSTLYILPFYGFDRIGFVQCSREGASTCYSKLLRLVLLQQEWFVPHQLL